MILKFRKNYWDTYISTVLWNPETYKYSLESPLNSLSIGTKDHEI